MIAVDEDPELTEFLPRQRVAHRPHARAGFVVVGGGDVEKAHAAGAQGGDRREDVGRAQRDVLHTR